jgi:hypothetical protein
VIEVGAILSSQVVFAGEEQSSNMTRRVWRFDSIKTFPVFQLVPIEGSPAVRPKGGGAGWFE